LTFNYTFKNKFIEKFIWQCVFVILSVVGKFLVIKAEHTVASYNDRDLKSKIATVYYVFHLNENTFVVRAVVRVVGLLIAYYREFDSHR
jgi:hypothetical protein